MLTKEEIREALVERHSEEVQSKLDEAKVAIAGLGGLGSNIAFFLTRIGIGHLHLIDFDRVDITNLNRQQYRMEHIGRYKTEALLEELRQYNDEDIYVIGGESIYRQLLPYCKVAHITKIDHAYEADTYFPNLDEMPEWKITGVSEEQTYFNLEYEFVKYERIG